MTSELNLSCVLKKENIVERLDWMFKIFQKELLKENASSTRSTWIWMKQLQHLVDVIQEKEDARKTAVESEPADEKEPVKAPVIQNHAVPNSPKKPIAEEPRNTVSVIRQARPPAKPHPVIVPLNKPVQAVKPEEPENANLSPNHNRKVDIKIGIQRVNPATVTKAVPVAVPTTPPEPVRRIQPATSHPMMIAVKPAPVVESPILIPITNSIKVQPKPESVAKPSPPVPTTTGS